MQFVSEQHQRTFEAVVRSFPSLGYTDALLHRRYQFCDWFDQSTPSREVPAAVFGRRPFTYDSACFAVLLPNGRTGKALVHEYRALGAPIALEVHERYVVQWKVGREDSETKEIQRFPSAAVERAFLARRHEWSSDVILRAKAIVPSDDGPQQLDFVDLGLIPALEGEIQKKLDDILQRVLFNAVDIYKKRAQKEPDYQKLYRLVFRCLAAKVFHDRRVGAFSAPLEADNVQSILRTVAEYYAEAPTTVLRDHATQVAVAQELWTGLNFQNLSADVLAYIYEKTLVTDEARKARGIHSTPYSLARYAVHRLPFEDIPEHKRYVLEPCCGHAVFLLAALQRLRDLLPNDLPDGQRHRYLAKMLHGYDVDPFALEVGRLCLLLADFPNKDGWQIAQADVHTSEDFAEKLRTTRFVLCNPPFEDFTVRPRHDVSVHQPIALLQRVLQFLHPQGTLGFVLPRKLLDGPSYRPIRRALVARFHSIEVVSLPDNVFAESRMESVLLVAKEPHTGNQSVLHFSQVHRNDSQRFLDCYQPSWSRTGPLDAHAKTFMLPPLPGLWEHLSSFPTLSSAVSEIHRGIEWAPHVAKSKRVHDGPAPSYELGIEKALGRLKHAFECPAPRYILTKEGSTVGNRIHYPWSFPKAVMNAARVSSGIWCIVAFADYNGLITSQRFQNLWPTGYWTANCLTAVLNGPVAGLYLAVRENKRDLHIGRIREIPLPRLNAAAIDRLDQLVAAYTNTVLKGGAPDYEQARTLLLEIDSIILAGYNLPEPLFHELLAYVRGEERPVPFTFEYPSDFLSKVDWHKSLVTSQIAYVDDVSPPTPHSDPLLPRYDFLLEKRFAGELTAVEEEELRVLREGIHRAHLATPFMTNTRRQIKSLYTESKRSLKDILARLRD
jgi:type I restriction-modification system DNA methylase subunit